MTDGRTVRVAAHAKVNLGLAITTRRGDGYHEIETIMARLDLADDIEVSLVSGAERQGVSASTSPSAGQDSDGDATVPTDDRNLAVRAALGYLRRLEPSERRDASVHIRLTKRVPVAAGLGGGSSDAAATLVALSHLLPAPVDLRPLALEVGSDVPFFLGPWRAALARGRGERLTGIAVPDLDIVLAKPPFGVAAGDAYEALVGFTPRLKAADIVSALTAGDEPGWRNALQPGVIRAHPEVRDVLAALKSAGLRGSILSGSGPTCFGLAASRQEAELVAAKLAVEHPSWRVMAASLDAT